MEKTVSVLEATELLGISKIKVYALIKSGKLIASRSSEKKRGRPEWRILESSIQTYKENK